MSLGTMKFSQTTGRWYAHNDAEISTRYGFVPIPNPTNPTNNNLDNNTFYYAEEDTLVKIYGYSGGNTNTNSGRVELSIYNSPDVNDEVLFQIISGINFHWNGGAKTFIVPKGFYYKYYGRTIGSYGGSYGYSAYHWKLDPNSAKPVAKFQ